MIKTKIEQGQWLLLKMVFLLCYKLKIAILCKGEEGNWLLVGGDFSRWGNDKQIFGWWGKDSSLGRSLKSRALALIFLKITHFIQNFNLNPTNKYLKISWPWGLALRSMFWAIWVQMINQAINLELQFSQDLVISRTIKGIQWTYKISYLNQRAGIKKKVLRAVRALKRAFPESIDGV